VAGGLDSDSPPGRHQLHRLQRHRQQPQPEHWHLQRRHARIRPSTSTTLSSLPKGSGQGGLLDVLSSPPPTPPGSLLHGGLWAGRVPHCRCACSSTRPFASGSPTPSTGTARRCTSAASRFGYGLHCCKWPIRVIFRCHGLCKFVDSARLCLLTYLKFSL
jgi:hypothetical protein